MYYLVEFVGGLCVDVGFFVGCDVGDEYVVEGCWYCVVVGEFFVVWYGVVGYVVVGVCKVFVVGDDLGCFVDGLWVFGLW